MRTWKQGRIGKIIFPDSNLIYLKCLKYPLAQFYTTYDITTKSIRGPLFIARLDKSTLRYIETIEQNSLDKDEKLTNNSDFETYDIDQLHQKLLLKLKNTSKKLKEKDG